MLFALLSQESEGLQPCIQLGRVSVAHTHTRAGGGLRDVVLIGDEGTDVPALGCFANMEDTDIPNNSWGCSAVVTVKFRGQICLKEGFLNWNAFSGLAKAVG